MAAPSAPKTDAPADNQDIALAILALAESIKAGQSNGLDNKLASIEKFLMERESARPHENLFNPPMISHYNPLGDRDNPRPELRCETLWVGYRLHKDNMTREEIELTNRLQPGKYLVTKADGRRIAFTVTPKFNEANDLEKISIHYPCKSSEDRSNHLSMVSYMREALGDVASTESLHAQIEALKQQLANVPA